MSDYFGTLLTLSRGAVAPAAGTAAPARPDAVGVAAIDTAHAVAAQRPHETPVPPTLRLPAQPQAHTSSAETPSSADGGVLSPRRADAARYSTRSEAAEPSSTSDAVVPSASEPRSERAPVSMEESRAIGNDRSAGEAMVLAALDWVAADAQRDKSLRRLGDRRELQSEQADETGTIVRARNDGDEEAQSTRERQRPIARPAAEPDAASTLAFESGFARALQSAAADPSDETVEISIGSINVRVDAPAPQRVTHAAPSSPAAAARPSAAAPERSGLARRALRRI